MADGVFSSGTQVAELARISRSKNAERDFHTWMHRSYGAVRWEPYEFPVVLLGRGEAAPRVHKVACMPPHELFAFLWAQGQATREECLIGPPGALENFWRQAVSSPAYADIPCASEVNSVVPFLIHYDGVEVYNLTECAVWQCSSLLGSSASVLDKNFLSCLIEVELLEGHLADDAHAAVAEMMAWSFAALLAGRWPTHGMRGEPLQGHRQAMAGEWLAGGMKGFCVGFQSDMKARRETHRHDRFYRTTHPCQKCLCMQPRYKTCIPALSFANFAVDAGWTWTSLTDDDYVETARDITPWIAVPGFKPLSFILEDFMHDCSLGIFRDLCANVVIQWLECRALHSFAQSQQWEFCDDESLLRALHLHWKSWLRAGGFNVKCSENLFTANRLGRRSKKAYPCLTTKAKAVVVNLLVQYLAELAPSVREFCFEPFHLAACSIVQDADCLQTLLRRAGVWLSETEAGHAQQVGRRFLKAWAGLARAALHRRRFQWKLKPKLHDVDEMLRKLSWCRLNPYHVSCMNPESFLGKIKRIAKATHRGKVGARTCQRYFCMVYLRAVRRERKMNACVCSAGDP